MSSAPLVFAIPAGVAFADALARGLNDRAGGDPLALARMTVILPTRRAARALTEGFLRVTDGQALLLPRLLALADLDGESAWAAAADLPAAIDRLERRLALARLIMARKGVFAVGPDQALRLAEALADLIDQAETEKRDFADLATLAPEALSEHWQATLEFLRIVTDHWPAILAERGMLDPSRRRVLALETRAAAWRADPPADPVIAAGFIEADPALAAVIGVIARLPQGMLVLPGLDLDLDNEGWDAVEPHHPQFGLKQLLEAIGASRKDVAPWPAIDPAERERARPRAKLLSEALRPAETTEAWRRNPAIDPAGLAGLTRVDCETVGEEAEVIALAMRHALETPGRTAALITPDRGLARRVAAALKRWNVDVDDSAGRALGETPVGLFLRLVAEAAMSDFAPRPLLAMLKHPLAACGLAPETLRRRVRVLERIVLRGPRPGPGLAGIRAALALKSARTIDEAGEDMTDLLRWLDDLAVRVAGLTRLTPAGGALSALSVRHAETAEALATTDDQAGGLRLWRDQDGEAAAELFAQLADPPGDDLSPIPADRYPAVLSQLMESVTIRPLYGVHTRLSIWGLIEARLQRADLMILGGLNEGVWPALPEDEPWMSRPMREKFGLKPLEARIGIAAQDFALAASAPEVLLTRALRVDGAPSVPARFLSRLDTLLTGLGMPGPRQGAGPWRRWAERLDTPDSVRPWPAPAPRPPVHARPRRLSVTAIETWMRNPYALYAKSILNLTPIDPIDADPGAAERGQFIHQALDRFVARHLKTLSEGALSELLEEGRIAFGDALLYPAVATFWWPRFERVAAWFVDFERTRRQDGVRPIATEISGRLEFTSRNGFTLTAKADRIDRLADGRLSIIDYKTGMPPDARYVSAGLAPQLPLEAVIALAGGFGPGIAGAIGELAFLQLSGGNPPGELQQALGKMASIEDSVDFARDGLGRLIAAYENPDTPYRARTRPEFAYAGDYDHLARIDEWAAEP
jgi:ATP-dependent helicase/nuclease subunit B